MSQVTTPFFRALRASLLDSSPAASAGRPFIDGLTLAGDALRIDVPLSAVWSNWLRVLSATELERALLACLSELERSFDEPKLSHRVKTCDQAESLVLAVSWTAHAQDVAPESLAGFVDLTQLLRELERQIGRSADEESILDALGGRRALATTEAWIWRCGSAPGAGRLASPLIDRLPVPDDLPGHLGPTDTAAIEYLTGGYHRAWVEGFAARSREFGETLDAGLEMLEFSGEALSLTAYRWKRSRRNAGRATEGPLRIEVRQVLAASSEPTREDEPELTRSLGLLPDVEVVALVRIFKDRIEFSATPIAGEHLAEISLHGVTERKPDVSGTWTVKADREPNTRRFEVSVVASDGRRFDDSIELFAH